MILSLLAGLVHPAHGAEAWRVTQLEDAGSGSLREALEAANAAGGGDVVFDDLDGVIRLGAPLPTVTANLRLTGPASGSVALSGEQSHPILAFAEGTTSTVTRLTFTLAHATTGRLGSAISNAGSLDIARCLFLQNTNRAGGGGAVYNMSALRLVDSEFLGNAVVGSDDVGSGATSRGSEENVSALGGGGGRAQGGAIFHDRGTLWIINCVFTENRVTGGRGRLAHAARGVTNSTPGGSAGGAAVYAGRGDVRCVASRFLRNAATGGMGGGNVDVGPGANVASAGGGASGAALLSALATLELQGCLFAGNFAWGGAGGIGLGLTVGQFGGPGGSASGGAIAAEFPERIRILRCSFLTNVSQGGSLGYGGSPSPGGRASGGGLSLNAGRIEILASACVSNRAVGGSQSADGVPYGLGYPGVATGGGIALRGGATTIENCTLSGNTAAPAFGQIFLLDPPISVEQPVADGGGLHVSDPQAGVTVRFSTIVSNTATGFTFYYLGSFDPRGQSGGRGGGVWVEPTAPMTLAATVIAGNRDMSFGEVSGRVVSLGRNLIQDPQGSEGWVEADLREIDPKLGALQDDGVGGWMHVPRPGSPVLDAATETVVPELDQRGSPRISGAAADLGAIEWQVPDPEPEPPRFSSVHMVFEEGPRLEFTVTGAAGKVWVLESSGDLRAWSEVSRVRSGETVRAAGDGASRYFRLLGAK